MNTGSTGTDNQVEWLNTKQVAQRLNQRGIRTTEGRLRQLRSAGRGPRYRKRDPDIPQSEVLYAAADVDQWIAEQNPANWPVAEPTP